MGKKSREKRQPPDPSVIPLPKQLAIAFEQSAVGRRVYPVLTRLCAHRQEAIAAAHGSGEAAAWPPSVYFPSTMMSTILEPRLRDLMATAISVDEPACSQARQTLRELEVQAMQIAALLAWRGGQGIYRFDPMFCEEVIAAEMDGAMPVEVLRCLPEWGVYVETPPGVITLPLENAQLSGFFAYYDAPPMTTGPDRRAVDHPVESLVLLPVASAWSSSDAPGAAHSEILDVPLIVPLLDGRNAPDCIALAIERAGYADHVNAEWKAAMLQSSLRMLSMTLYLCSEAPDITGPFGQPARREAPKNAGIKLSPLHPVRPWDVGQRLGAALRHARDDIEREERAVAVNAGTGQRPRPHLRRGHWHSFLIGKRDVMPRQYRVKWLQPMLVNAQGADELIPTVHDVPGR